MGKAEIKEIAAYLKDLEARVGKFSELGVSVAAISGDTEAQTNITAEASKCFHARPSTQRQSPPSVGRRNSAT